MLDSLRSLGRQKKGAGALTGAWEVLTQTKINGRFPAYSASHDSKDRSAPRIRLVAPVVWWDLWRDGCGLCRSFG